ncbi:hypothetical protein QBC32DRAFT_353827, partial [Pseudoneurospora amorphoporcata]
LQDEKRCLTSLSTFPLFLFLSLSSSFSSSPPSFSSSSLSFHSYHHHPSYHRHPYRHFNSINWVFTTAIPFIYRGL